MPASARRDVVLITGAAGWMGQHALRLAAQRFRVVIAIDVQQPRVIPVGVHSFHRVDFTKIEEVQRLYKHIREQLRDGERLYIWHIGGLFNYAALKELLIKVNVQGTVNLVTAIARPMHREGWLGSFVYWSGTTVYGDFNFPLPATENSPINPINDYGMSKYTSEKLLLNLFRKVDFPSRFPAVILQITGAYGPGMDPAKPYGMGILFKLFWEGRLQNLPLTGSAKRYASLVHVEDIMRAAYFLSYTPEARGERFIVTDDGQHNAIAISKLLGKELRNPFIPIPLPVSVFKFLSWLIELHRRWYKINPLIDSGLAQMMTLNTHASNAKLWTLAEKHNRGRHSADPLLKYPDSLVGLKAAIDDMKKEGFLQ